MNSKKQETNKKSSSGNLKVAVLTLFVLLVVTTLSATLAYTLTSKHYLDRLDSQNQQIHILQNALRKANNLPELEATQ